MFKKLFIDEEIYRNLWKIMKAADEYFIDVGEEEVTAEELIRHGAVLREFPPSLAGEDYREVFPIKTAFTELSVTKADGSVVTLLC